MDQKTSAYFKRNFRYFEIFRTDFEKSFILSCDASEAGLGAVLCQNQDGKLKVIRHASRALTPAEKKVPSSIGKT